MNPNTSSSALDRALASARAAGVEDTASHLPVLHEFLRLRPGSILELGGGLCSTPFIREMLPNHRVVTLESNARWKRRIRRLVGRNSRRHKLKRVRNWDKVDWKKLCQQQWTYVFVDHAPGERRLVEILRLIDHCDLMIIHDTDADRGKGGAYGWAAVEGIPKYWREYLASDPLPSTSVCSNRVDPVSLVDLF